MKATICAVASMMPALPVSHLIPTATTLNNTASPSVDTKSPQRRRTHFSMWPHLPTSLKLAILDILLVDPSASPVSELFHYTLHKYHVDLTSLLLTSSSMQDLAWRSYYKHGIVLKPDWNAAEDHFIRMPSAAAATHIRRVEVHLETPDIFRGVKMKWGVEDLEDLGCLVRPVECSGEERLYCAKKMAWSRRLTNVVTLKIVLDVKSEYPWYGTCLKGIEGWTDIFKHVVGVVTQAQFVQVEVHGFKCDAKAEVELWTVEAGGFTRHVEGAVGACECGCQEKVARAFREFLSSQGESVAEDTK
jgi:hypothetical protein